MMICARKPNHKVQNRKNIGKVTKLSTISVKTTAYRQTLLLMVDHIRQVLIALRKRNLFIKMVKCFWVKRETEYLGFIDENGNNKTTFVKVAILNDWPLPRTQKQNRSFVAFCSLYRKFTHHCVECSAPLSNLCRKSLPGRVVHCDVTRVVLETLKSRIISAHVLLIPKSSQDAEFDCFDRSD
jgi:hypothetical protein